MDVFLSHDWPSSVGLLDKQNKIPQRGAGCTAILELNIALKPRYHFCSMNDVYFEPPPFRFNGMFRPPCRFVSLASVANPQKAKWLYALSITPQDKLEQALVLTEPEGTVDFPIAIPTSSSKRKADDTNEPSSKNLKPVNRILSLLVFGGQV